jgi:hypothetical protein
MRRERELCDRNRLWERKNEIEREKELKEDGER